MWKFAIHHFFLFQLKYLWMLNSFEIVNEHILFKTRAKYLDYKWAKYLDYKYIVISVYGS